MTHERGNEKCPVCREGFPVKCEKCDGGLVHASKGCVIITDCDRCPREVLIGKEDQEP